MNKTQPKPKVKVKVKVKAPVTLEPLLAIAKDISVGAVPKPQWSWINGDDHISCRCGALLKVILALPWHIRVGARRVGICKRCGRVVVDREDGGMKWLWQRV